MWTQGHVGYLFIPAHTNICYLITAVVQPVTLPPPPPPPPPSSGIESGPPSLHPSVNGKGRSALLSSIQSFSKGRLKKAETIDRSNPHIWATLLMVLIMCNLSWPSNQMSPRSDLQEWKDVLKLDCWEKQFSNISLPKSAADQRWWGWSVGYLCCYKGYDLGICILAVRFINWTWIFVVNNHTHSTTMFLTPIKSASIVMWCFQAAYNYLGWFSTERLFFFF